LLENEFDKLNLGSLDLGLSILIFTVPTYLPRSSHALRRVVDVTYKSSALDKKNRQEHAVRSVTNPVNALRSCAL